MILHFRFSVIALCSFLLMTTSHGQDLLMLTSGETQKGTLISADANRVRMKIILGAGSAETYFPIHQIVSVQFTPTSEEQAALASPSAKTVPLLESMWRRREGFLAVKGSDSGTVGIKLAEALLAPRNAAVAPRIVALCQAIADKDWDEARRVQVEGVRLKALVLGGNTEAAMAAANKMSGFSSADAATLVEAKFAVAEAKAAAFRNLETNFPKWHELREKRTERENLLQEALDAYLYPAVFQVRLTPLCARGLWKAAELAHAAGMKREAKTWALEITESFPDPSHVGRARELLKQIETQPTEEKSKEKSS